MTVFSLLHVRKGRSKALTAATRIFRNVFLAGAERNNGNRTQTARDLGVDPRTIFRYLEREANPPPPGGGGGAKTTDSDSE